ncbi:rhotekin-like isoform X2 [Condylostylus longicornis]|uniref:rhotekin-like isoform X2 n=1 Tax=Condylostylus longicornis TaxID=2530218 RepID=UPI00244DB8B1|nr:rhotekin-like isoform X2 [Condylostylus longicornis]
MESCFPPLAALSLRGSSHNNSKSQKNNRHSTGGSTPSTASSCNNLNNHNNSNNNNNNNNNNINNNSNSNGHNNHCNSMSNNNDYCISNSKKLNQNNSSTDFTPKLEVLQDLDLYYIRQIASSLKELDLEQKIDLEIKMREGSAKLLAACNNSRNGSSNTLNNHTTHNTQMLEAAKNLLTSNERMTAYMAELQRRKRDKDTLAKTKPRGKVSLSEIRMPLMWRDTDHFKNKGDYRRFAVFCLAKIGTEIYDTSLLSPVDRNLTDLCFNDAILFTNITPDFELKLEVYAVMMESDLSIASTPRKIKNTIHSSISRTVGRKLAANLKDELNNTKIGPKFELIATAHLTLAEASDTAHTHDLCLNPNNATVNISNKLPLFGHFCCRLAIQPDFYEQSTINGEICLLQKEPTRPIQGYARLQAFRVEIWDDEKAFQGSYQPRRSVGITRETKLKLRTGETDLVVTNLENGSIEEYILRTKTAPDALKWYSAVKKAIREHNQWGHVCQSEPMQLAVPYNPRNYFVRNTRQGSFYDQVPILESLDNRQSSRPNVQDIFAIPNSNGNSHIVSGIVTNVDVSNGNSTGDTSPTLNDFRNRTYSSGRSSTHSSSTLSASSIGSINSRKSHWPFSGK